MEIPMGDGRRASGYAPKSEAARISQPEGSMPTLSPAAPSRLRELGKATPQFNLGQLVATLRERAQEPLLVQDDGTLVISDPGMGTSRQFPHGQLGAPLQGEEGSEERFLARVSVLHRPLSGPGIPNFWRSCYEAPDGLLRIQFFRSGTPVSATLPPALGEPSPNDLSNVWVDSENAYKNVQLLKDSIAQRPRVWPLDGSAPRMRRGVVVSIDLQSPVGIAAEVPITAMQRRASGGRLMYLNIPVHAKNYGDTDLWNLPLESNPTIGEIFRLACTNIQTSTPYTAPFGSLMEDARRLWRQDLEGSSTPATRYALAARLGLLALVAGFDLHVNCRSGKDRTGLFDTEVKFAAYQLWRRSQGLPVSEPGCAVLPDEREAWKLLLLRSGNREIQHLNAGAPGNRVTTELLKERIGEEFWDEYVGEALRAED
jgi:hypothetical protein